MWDRSASLHAAVFRVACILGIQVIALSVISIATTDVASASVTVPVHEFNMCSNKCRTSAPGDPADIVNFLVAVEDVRPWAIMLVEVCSPEYVEVRDYLQGLGYTPQRIITTNVGGACGQYGNALFYLGSSVGTLKQWPLSTSPEPRKLACHSVSTFGGPMAHCVGHSGATSHPDEMLYIMNVEYGSSRRFFGGDLNATPPALNPLWYGNSVEADGSQHWTFNTMSATVRRKLDYAFVTKPAVAVNPGTLCDQNWSDHCYLVGDMVL
jgi:hypothetical protein